MSVDLPPRSWESAEGFRGAANLLALETSSQLSADRLSYYGIFLGAVAYGFNVAVFVAAVHFLRKGIDRSHGRRDYLWVVYASVLFFAATAGNAVHIEFTQDVFIGHRNYPGGPSVYYAVGSTKYMSSVHLVVYAITLICQDGLLLYRCWIIYCKGSKTLILLIIVFSTALGCAIAGLISLAARGAAFWEQTRLIVALGLGTLSCTILLTIAIVFRLLTLRRYTQNILTTPLVPYISLAGIFIESAVVYTAGTLAFLIAYCLRSPVQGLLFPIALQGQSLAPLLIILRMAMNRAYPASASRTPYSRTRSLTFPGGSGARRSLSSDSDAPRRSASF